MRLYVRCKVCDAALGIVEYDGYSAFFAFLNNRGPKEPVLLLPPHQCTTIKTKYPDQWISGELPQGI